MRKEAIEEADIIVTTSGMLDGGPVLGYIGHNAIVHGARIDDNVLIGMGSIILNNAHMKSGTVVAAGSVVMENFESENNSLVTGMPGRIKKIDKKYYDMAYNNSLEYIKLNNDYRDNKYGRYKNK